MKRVGVTVLSIVTIAALVCGCNVSQPSDSLNTGEPQASKVQLRFLQNKLEAKEIFNELITAFEKQHPNIEITQINDREAEQLLTSMVAKNDAPDLVAIGATDTFVTLANTAVFSDFSGDPSVKNIMPTYIDTVRALSSSGQINGIPYSANVNGILYNKALFRQFGLQIPKTWPELISLAESIREKKQTPFTSHLKKHGRLWCLLMQ
ncbi:ABC transporter substrate-binding protein [Paenibacillus hexagrammi]|uniref:ABC transporter substrate-binding protein n=1 Tax=Paenibacillus hexagrammi TaxID=2908839 RepID=UPI0021A39AE7|nr:ABC transporter substrate-binding protein [Paenibacillus sp. YPD9-1]